MKKSIKILIIVIAAVILTGIIGGTVISGMAKGLENFLATVEIKPVDLDRLNDGIYEGRTDAGIIQVRLEVNIKSHKITDIVLLKHQNGQGSEAEKLIPRIIEEQRVDLDTISGATYSSLAILNAVSNALAD